MFKVNNLKFTNFIKNRFNNKIKNGLYLTIGTIIAFFFAYIFLDFTRDLLNKPGIMILSQFDINLFNKIQNLRNPFLNNFMLLITRLGDWETVLITAFSLTAIFLILKKLRYAITIIISLLIGESFVYIVKNIMKRQGPPLRYFFEKDFSFPSGHSFIAIIFYGLVFYFVFKSLKYKLLKLLSLFTGAVLIILICFSRIYLGIHWPSDVFAGFASGATLLTAIITFLEIDNKFNIKINLFKLLHLRS